MGRKNFQKGDLLQIRTTGEKVMAIEYKINHAGGIFNALSGENKFAESVVTEDVLCEGKIDGKFQRKYINENNLELISSAQ